MGVWRSKKSRRRHLWRVCAKYVGRLLCKSADQYESLCLVSSGTVRICRSACWQLWQQVFIFLTCDLFSDQTTLFFVTFANAFAAFAAFAAAACYVGDDDDVLDELTSATARERRRRHEERGSRER